MAPPIRSMAGTGPDIHAPDDYRCPFCALASGADMPEPYTTQQEVVLREPDVLAFVASHQWPKNPGHAVVIPREHFENLSRLRAALDETAAI